MAKPLNYPDSQVKITAPFFTLTCRCGLRMWSLLGEITPCPKCGRIMQQEDQIHVGTEIHI